ncbi:MAG TPA: histidine phosphotransferase family protein [Stellaceae bacterium]|nr:histidine phosphotransferase family protein [Stellaceae bacterium]
MTKTLELLMAEVLSARLCHELISPIGAVGNGLELLEDEEGGGFAQDALALIVVSARQAASRLQFYRLAYGSTTPLGEEMVRAAVNGLFEGSKMSVDWPADVIPEPLRKLACNLLLLATETVPRGGRLALRCDAPGGLTVTATGEGARTAPHIVAILDGSAADDAPTPRSVQTVFTMALAQAHGTALAVDDSVGGQVRLAVRRVT